MRETLLALAKLADIDAMDAIHSGGEPELFARETIQALTELRDGLTLWSNSV